MYGGGGEAHRILADQARVTVVHGRVHVWGDHGVRGGGDFLIPRPQL